MEKVRNRVRLKDIAAELNISIATVSLCLNDRPGRYQVNAETVRKVREFAAAVGYVPDRNARNLRRGARRCVGLLTNHHWRAGQKCLPAVFAAEQRLTAAGFECRQLSSRNQLTGLSQLRELGCSEVIIFDPVTEEPSYGNASWQTGELAARFPDMPVYSVDYTMPDAAGVFAADKLVRLGCRVWDFNEHLLEIMQKYFPGECMIHPWRCSQSIIGRWRTGKPDLILKIEQDDPFKVGEDGAHQYLSLRRKYNISNIFWGDDRMACGFINELLKNGVDVPGEVNVISFDNLDFSQYLAIPLTTCGVPIVRHTNMVLDAILNNRTLENRVSRPLFSPGKSARLTPEIIAEISRYCDIGCDDTISV